MNLSDLKETPTREQEIDFEDEMIKIFHEGKEKGYSLRQMAEKVREHVFYSVRDLRQENIRLGRALKEVKIKQAQGRL